LLLSRRKFSRGEKEIVKEITSFTIWQIHENELFGIRKIKEVNAVNPKSQRNVFFGKFNKSASEEILVIFHSTYLHDVLFILPLKCSFSIPLKIFNLACKTCYNV
jgi:hypothetical protein